MLKKTFLLAALLVIGVSAVQLYGQTRMISHLTRAGGGFKSTVILENRSVHSADYVLTPYDVDGNLLDVVTGTLEGQASLSTPATDLFPGDVEASHFQIQGDDVFVTVAYDIVEGQGSPAHVQESSASASSYRIFPGQWSSVFDGIAFVNTGSETADIWVAQKDFTGTIIQSDRAAAALAPMAKGLYVIGSVNGSAFEDRNDVFYEVYATQTLAITALRGNLPGSNFLWVNQAEPRSESVTTRDDKSVWFVDGGSFYDVHEAFGYNVAVDRLWQLEKNRRTGLGTMAEIYGNSALETDRFQRSFYYTEEEYEAGFKNLSLDAQTAIKAYVDGINRRIAEVHADEDILPYEFKQFGLTQIRDWNSTDVLAYLTFVSRQFDPNGFAIRQAILFCLAQELFAKFPSTVFGMFDDLYWPNDPEAQTMIPPEPGQALPPQQPKAQWSFSDQYIGNKDNLELLENYIHTLNRNEEFLKSVQSNIKLGSFAWVVSGDKTESGYPTLYGGPQMGFQAPSFITEASIRGGGMNVSGMTIPGLPFIVIGRTPHHAWSMMVGHAHTADLYIDGPGTVDGPHHTAIIKVRGEEDVVHDVYRNIHGPSFNEPVINLITWKYAHWGREFDTMDAFLTMARTEDMDEFGGAMEKVASSLHFLYADRDNNIGYWMTGRNPIRPPGEYRVPQGALAPALEYDIDVVREVPHVRNPEQGFLAGWNTKAAVDYNDGPFGVFGPLTRGHLMQDYFASKDSFTFEEIRDFAMEVGVSQSIVAGGKPWQFVGDAFSAIVAANPTDARTAAVAIMDSWDGAQIDGGPENWATGTDLADGWMLANQWFQRIVLKTFRDEIENEEFALGALFNNVMHAMDEFNGVENTYDWFTNLLDADAPQTFEDIVIASLDDSLADLGERPWGTGRRGTFGYFSEIGLELPTHPNGNRATYGQAVEVGPNGPTRIESVMHLGQSGNVLGDGQENPEVDPDYTSMVELFNLFQHRSFPLFQ